MRSVKRSSVVFNVFIIISLCVIISQLSEIKDKLQDYC
nr:MAG TPA_asm: hypothetical protein [Caudoviricetes sp.]